jgi:heme/copper-type cytochrome/quinol oxidase subunit 2
MIFSILDKDHRFYSIFVQTTSKIQYKRWQQTKNSQRAKEHKEQETPKKSEKNQR